ncbi:MAG: 2-oxoacid:acceptor oxidoreductase family protein [Promethearchaeota archaeon]
MDKNRVEIGIFGRGGQGGITASNLLVKAAYKTGKYKHVMAIPFFGAERRGAPVSAYARISKHNLYERSRIDHPDIVIIMDPGILKATNPINDLKKDGYLLVNTSEKPDVFKQKNHVNESILVATVDILKICLDINLMRDGSTPVFNMPILGAFCKIFNEIPLEVMLDTIIENFGSNLENGKLNARGAEMAYKRVEIK